MNHTSTMGSLPRRLERKSTKNPTKLPKPRAHRKTPEYDRPSKGRFFNGSFRLGVFGFRHLEWAECAVAPRQRDSIYRDNRQMGRKKKVYIYIDIYTYLYLSWKVTSALMSQKSYKISRDAQEICARCANWHPSCIQFHTNMEILDHITSLIYFTSKKQSH